MGAEDPRCGRHHPTDGADLGCCSENRWLGQDHHELQGTWCGDGQWNPGLLASLAKDMGYLECGVHVVFDAEHTQS